MTKAQQIKQFCWEWLNDTNKYGIFADRRTVVKGMVKHGRSCFTTYTLARPLTLSCSLNELSVKNLKALEVLIKNRCEMDAREGKIEQTTYKH